MLSIANRTTFADLSEESAAYFHTKKRATKFVARFSNNLSSMKYNHILSQQLALATK